MKDERGPDDRDDLEDEAIASRRDFLVGLGKWSAVVIGAALFGATAGPTDVKANWVNRRGGAWVNGGGWVNRGGGAWVNGGRAWVNRGGGAWVNGGGGWVNRGGGSWVNRRGGGGWINR